MNWQSTIPCFLKPKDMHWCPGCLPLSLAVIQFCLRSASAGKGWSSDIYIQGAIRQYIVERYLWPTSTCLSFRRSGAENVMWSVFGFSVRCIWFSLHQFTLWFLFLRFMNMFMHKSRARVFCKQKNWQQRVFAHLLGTEKTDNKVFEFRLCVGSERKKTSGIHWHVGRKELWN